MSKQTNSKSRKLITIAATTAALCLPLLSAGSAEARPNRRNAHNNAATSKRSNYNKRNAPIARGHIGVQRRVLMPPPARRVAYKRPARVVYKRPGRVVYKRPLARQQLVSAQRFHHNRNITVCRTVTEVQYRSIWLAGLRITKPVQVHKEICRVVPAPNSHVYRF